MLPDCRFRRTPVSLSALPTLSLVSNIVWVNLAQYLLLSSTLEGAIVTATEDDIPDDIKTLIEIGVYTLEEALAKCTVTSGREKRMVIRKPSIKMVHNICYCHQP